MSEKKQKNCWLILKKVARLFLKRPKAKEDWQKEFPDLKLRYLIRHSEKKFVVGIDELLDIDWQTSTDFDKETQADKSQRDQVYSEVVRLETMVGRKWPEDEQLQAKRMVGEALVQSFYGQKDESKRALERAERFIKQKSIEVSRCLILFTSMIFFAGVIIVGALLYIFRSTMGEVLGESMVLCLLSACMGGIGTFSVIVLRIRKLTVPSTSGPSHHRMEALGMMTTGCVAGFAVMLLIKSGLAFSAFANNGNFPFLVMVLAMGAGMSMRWVNLVIGQFDTVEEKPKSKEDVASSEALPKGDAND